MRFITAVVAIFWLTTAAIADERAPAERRGERPQEAALKLQPVGAKLVAIYAADENGEPSATAKRFFKAFIDGDVQTMTPHFADKVLFDGDSKFLGREKADDSPEVSKQQLSDAYSKLFERVGSERWKQAFQKSKPTLTQASVDGKPIKIVKKGDYVYDLHFREANKGQRAGLDEAVIFVFRKVDDRYLIVGHFADY